MKILKEVVSSTVRKVSAACLTSVGRFVGERTAFSLIDRFSEFRELTPTSQGRSGDLLSAVLAMMACGEAKVIRTIGTVSSARWMHFYGDGDVNRYAPAVKQHGLFQVTWKGNDYLIRIMNRNVFRRKRLALFGYVPKYELSLDSATTLAAGSGALADRLVSFVFFSKKGNQEGLDAFVSRIEEITEIYRARNLVVRQHNADGVWNNTANVRRAKVGLQGVYTEEVMKGLFEDAKRWDSHEDLYLELNIPYQRGYLFEGPPGTGKTSAARDLACMLRRPCNVISLNDLTDTTLITAMTGIHGKAVILIEDIDTMAAARDRAEDKRKKGLTLSGLLNAINGVTINTGCVFVLTSNDPDSLDEALLRVGRIDSRIYFGPLPHEKVVEFIVRKCASNPPVIPAGVVFRPIKGCDLQELLVKHLDNFQDFVDAIPKVNQPMIEG